jgi:MFS family permease
MRGDDMAVAREHEPNEEDQEDTNGQGFETAATNEHNGVMAAGVERRMVTMALLLAMAVAALEQTVVSTAMPTILARLKGLNIYPWVFSAYLLAATISTPLYGKLADLVGRKRILLFGLGLFSVGSALSGCAQSMPWLIAMRVVQGLGAGALGPIVLTMIGDIYTLKERAKVQGLFSGIWGGCSLVGPAIGGILTDKLSWRAVFFVTVPFSVVSAWVLVRHVHENLKHKEVPPIDWAGAGLLASGSAALLLAVLGGSGPTGGINVWLILLGVVLLASLVVVERRAADPVLPLDLMLRPTIAAAIVGSFLVGAMIFGIDTYVPLYIQGVLGGDATHAGRMITPLFMAWAISVAVAAKLVIRLGFRRTGVVGSSLIAGGALAIAWGSMYPQYAVPVFVVGLVVTGLGMGPVSLCYILGVQNSVDWNRRGAATGATIFFRTLGGALGVGVLGATLGFVLVHRLADAGVSGIDVAAALRPETHKLLHPEQLLIVQASLRKALTGVFLQMFGVAALGIACSFGLQPGRAVERREQNEPTPDDSLAMAAANEL